MKKRTVYITLFLIFIIGLISLIGTFAIDSTITEGNSTKADYLFNITLGDRTNREIVIPSYDSKIVDIKISNPNEFNMAYLLYLDGINSNISIINISGTESSGILNSKTNAIIKVFIQNNSSSDITTSIKDIVGFEKEKLSVPSNGTAINKETYYKVIVKSNNNDYGKVKPNIKLSANKGIIKYTIVPNTGYQYKSTTCNGTVSNNILTISNITSNTTCEVVFEPIQITVNFDLAGGVVETTYTEPKEHTYTVLYNGTYKLETWGAQGGTTIDGTSGGYGGYSTGNINLNIGSILYVNVGGAGGRSDAGAWQNVDGGYNGGGSTGGQGCCGRSYGSGGGATHIAAKSGILSSLSSSLSSIYIVSGGGGGAYYGENVGTYGLQGGSGGGYIGVDGVESTVADNQWCAGLGATQISGGMISSNCSKSSEVDGGTITGSFGQGGSGTTSTGGGGGYYGGSRSGHIAPAGGGSGYIGNSLLTNKYMYCYNCTTSDAANTKTYATTNTSSTPISNYAKSGNGAAKITLMSDVSYKAIYNTKYSNLPTPTRSGYTFDGWYTGENGTGTKITSDTLLTNGNDHTLYAKWIKDVKVTFDNNIFSTSSNSMTVNGLSINYDPSTSYLTLNGTPTSSGITFNKLYGLNFTLNEQYVIKTTYVSGSFKDSGSTGGCFVIEIRNSSAGAVSTRTNADLGFTTSYGESTLTINSSTVNEGHSFDFWLYFNTPTDWMFTNYKVKIDVTKVESKNVKQSQQYGTLPIPTRSGYVFDGWYTGENGTGTKITSDTVVTNTNNHTLYAHWTLNDITPPTCTLSASDTTITATYSDTGGSGLAYYGWSSSYSGSNSNTGTINSTGTYTFYVKDNAGNTGSCSGTVESTTQSSYTDCGSNLQDSGGCYYYTSASSHLTGSFYCKRTSTGSVTQYNCANSGGANCPSGYTLSSNNCSYVYSCSSGYLVNKSCKIYTSGTTVTTYACASGYTKLNNNYCWK